MSCRCRAAIYKKYTASIKLKHGFQKAILFTLLYNMNEDDFKDADTMQWFVNTLLELNAWDGKFSWNINVKELGDEKYIQFENSFILRQTIEASVAEASKTIISGDIHLVYSHIYQVPVIYFNYYYTSGSYLSLEDIEKYILCNSKDILNAPVHQVILQTEHPILRRPFFMLHPCRTRETLEQFELYTNSRGSDGIIFAKKYLFTWFHVYGALLNLSVPAACFSSVLKSLEIEEGTSENTSLEEVE